MSDRPDNPAIPAPTWSEENVRDALIQARGDLFVAAQMMGHMTSLQLDRAIRASADLQTTFLAIKAVKALAEYDSLSAEQVESEITRRLTFYRSDALEAIHELATMQVSSDANMANVKLSAAKLLAGDNQRSGDKTDLAETLRALNERYQSTAQRIRVTRTSIDIGPGEKVIEG